MHSRDGGKDAGQAGRGLEFETPYLTFMQAVPARSRPSCFMKINQEADAAQMPVEVALRLRHTYEGQPNAVNQGLGVLLGLLRPPQQWPHKAFVAVEPHLGMLPNLVHSQIVERALKLTFVVG